MAKEIELFPCTFPRVVTRARALARQNIEVKCVADSHGESSLLDIEKETHTTTEAAVVDGEDIVEIYNGLMIQAVGGSDRNFCCQAADGRGDGRHGDCAQPADGHIPGEDENRTGLVQGCHVNGPH